MDCPWTFQLGNANWVMPTGQCQLGNANWAVVPTSESDYGPKIATHSFNPPDQKRRVPKSSFVWVTKPIAHQRHQNHTKQPSHHARGVGRFEICANGCQNKRNRNKTTFVSSQLGRWVQTLTPGGLFKTRTVDHQPAENPPYERQNTSPFNCDFFEGTSSCDERFDETA